MCAILLSRICHSHIEIQRSSPEEFVGDFGLTYRSVVRLVDTFACHQPALTDTPIALFSARRGGRPTTLIHTPLRGWPRTTRTTKLWLHWMLLARAMSYLVWSR